MMKKILNSFVLIGLFSSVQTVAAELKIFTDVSRATGEVRVYLENTSDKNMVVLTRNLTTGQSGDEITLSPDRHVVMLNKRMVILKEDLAHYGAVTLKPGDITYIHRPSIDIRKGTLKYKINAKWATLHDVWAGTVQTTF